ncbi:MAG: 8-amino-7-oxononanoate synthase [Steroidobacteraceae bacterium]
MRPRPRELDAALAEIERQHLTRERRTVEALGGALKGAFDAPGGAEVVADGRRLVNFCGNDYLGLARHPQVAEALRRGGADWGVGSGASHLVTGHGAEHARLEEELAAYVGRERALLFSTGYMANLAAITTLAGWGDLALLDRASHASLIDAALLCGARWHRYPHGDARAADRALGAAQAAGASDPRGCLVATDGVFSMDGDIAPVADLARSAAEHEAWLVVDDAHGLGVIGATGRGTLEHLGGLDAEAVPVLVGTLGKAFGTFGAFIAGSRALIELLIQRARSYIYTTALPQALAAATRAALTVAQREAWRRERVLALTQRFRAAARERALPLAASQTPIQPVLIGEPEAAVDASRKLLEAGFWVAAIRPPTVPRGTARLRITLSAAHTEAQVDALADALASALQANTPPRQTVR